MSKYGQEEISVAFTKIQDIILKSLQSVAKVIINDKQCFELYGFDILMDEKLCIYFLQVWNTLYFESSELHFQNTI